jgi:hypothetical protein
MVHHTLFTVVVVVVVATTATTAAAIVIMIYIIGEAKMFTTRLRRHGCFTVALFILPRRTFIVTRTDSLWKEETSIESQLAHQMHWVVPPQESFEFFYSF